MARLKEKVAIITGGARGMGAATARLFVAEGAKVAITDVRDADGAALARELGSAAHFYPHDVGDPGRWRGLVGQVAHDLGPIDVLVNNAGVLIMGGLLDMPLEDFERVMRVNLTGAFLGIQAVAPGMIARGKGSIINISSIEGFRGSNGMAAYAPSKWGLRGLTRVAALELGHQGVRVNSVHPGAIETPMVSVAGKSPEEINANFKHVPAQRIGQPDEVAQASLFLASDEASYLMGSEIVVDGGFLAGGYTWGMAGAPAHIR